jgi:hypothetical protein
LDWGQNHRYRLSKSIAQTELHLPALQLLTVYASGKIIVADFQGMMTQIPLSICLPGASHNGKLLIEACMLGESKVCFTLAINAASVSVQYQPM